MVAAGERSFAFVDLAGFTALTESHGDAAAAALVTRFCQLAEAALTSNVRLVKSIGDAVLLSADDPASCLDTVAALMRSCLDEPGFPLPRAGAHHGSAVEQEGDWFGAGVNIAARVAALAAGGRLLTTAGFHAAAGAAGFSIRELGETHLRGLVEPVHLYEIAVAESDPLVVIDPVCRMRCTTSDAIGMLRHEGVESWFCSLACLQRFMARPAAFLVAATS